jgi:L-rhamnose-H+ transport protein
MVFALVVLPLAVTSMTIPNLSVVYHSTAAEHNSRSLWRWCRMGVTPVSLSLLDMIGIALVFSIVLGTAAAIGSLIPMVTLHREPLKSAAGVCSPWSKCSGSSKRDALRCCREIT